MPTHSNYLELVADEGSSSPQRMLWIKFQSDVHRNRVPINVDVVSLRRPIGREIYTCLGMTQQAHVRLRRHLVRSRVTSLLVGMEGRGRVARLPTGINQQRTTTMRPQSAHPGGRSGRGSGY